MNKKICKRCKKNPAITEMEEYCETCLKNLMLHRMEYDISNLKSIQASWDEQDRQTKIKIELDRITPKDLSGGKHESIFA